MSSVPTLGVVMPVYNEGDWVRRSVEALHRAAERADLELDVLVVDDGSTGDHPRVLDDLADRGDIRLLRQENAGRLAARSAGLAALDHDYVLLLDARVILHPDSLVTLVERLSEAPDSVWNAHVDVVSRGNPWAAFWAGITKVGWRAYFANPRRLTFGTEDFDRYPKGTGAFAAPRRALLDAAGDFSSLYEDARFASDDTKLLRNVAASHRIGLDPGFSVDYHGRDSAGRWAKQVLFRGTTFVDGYVGTPRRAAMLLAALGLAVPAGLVVAWRAPRVAAAAAVAAPVAAGVAAAASGATAREAGWVGVLLWPFTLIFGTGFVRGLVMALRGARRR
ncbi:glycosyltransferase family 2 protein [Propioniciclava coleopterorum]|uniref:Glycosyltransferase family 2 protein n=1 Tax=Propioniciclava coleopterorum TaxID=2714937 RepID=A0A6G7Y531_9ACTN|nr:glycosyltransferase family A protein [Propioniciclava coleopterorum]QIK71727.1 glycosyltransferase family 2 protein [Propioniciclava coleopterorum]